MALKHILTAKAQEREIVILNEIPWKEVSTKKAFEDLTQVVHSAPFVQLWQEGRKIRKYSNRGRRNITLVIDDSELYAKLSLRNIPWVKTISISRMAAHPLLYNFGLVFSQAAFDKMAQVNA